MEHFELKDITDAEWQEIGELYRSAERRLNNLLDEDSIISACNHVSGYVFIKDTYNEDVYTISIATDNREPNTLQGIRVYAERNSKPIKLSKYIDIYFNDEEYPFEDVEV